MTLSIAGVPIGGEHPCRFVAEMSNNHNGSLDRAIRLIDAAKAAGADFVKFQCYLPSELVTLRGDGPAPEPWGSQGWSMRRLYEKAQTPHDWFPRLVQHCQNVGIPWFSSVFGPESLALLESLDCPAYKIARLDNQQWLFGARVLGTFKPVIVSTSGSDDPAVHGVLSLYCPPGYPQASFGFGVRPFDAPDCYHDRASHFDGFSYHGTDPLPCVVAATLGAKIIEAHFHSLAEPSELESDISLDRFAFQDMVRDVRRVEAMLA